MGFQKGYIISTSKPIQKQNEHTGAGAGKGKKEKGAKGGRGARHSTNQGDNGPLGPSLQAADHGQHADADGPRRLRHLPARRIRPSRGSGPRERGFTGRADPAGAHQLVRHELCAARAGPAVRHRAVRGARNGTLVELKVYLDRPVANLLPIMDTPAEITAELGVRQRAVDIIQRRDEAQVEAVTDELASDEGDDEDDGSPAQKSPESRRLAITSQMKADEGSPQARNQAQELLDAATEESYAAESSEGEFEFDATVDNITGTVKAAATTPPSKGMKAKREQLKRKHQFESAYQGAKIAKTKPSPGSRIRFTPEMDRELRDYVAKHRTYKVKAGKSIFWEIRRHAVNDGAALGGKTTQQIKDRWRIIERNAVKEGVQRFGVGNWHRIREGYSLELCFRGYPGAIEQIHEDVQRRKYKSVG